MPYTSWWTCTPPTLAFRNGPRPARMDRVMNRVTRNVTTKAPSIHATRTRRPLKNGNSSRWIADIGPPGSPVAAEASSPGHAGKGSSTTRAVGRQRHEADDDQPYHEVDTSQHDRGGQRGGP